MNQDERTESAILGRAIMPQTGGWSSAAAHSLLQLRLAATDLARADELALKAVEGVLSPDEVNELENYRHAGRVLEMLKAKARVSLKNAGAA